MNVVTKYQHDQFYKLLKLICGTRHKKPLSSNQHPSHVILARDQSNDRGLKMKNSDLGSFCAQKKLDAIFPTNNHVSPISQAESLTLPHSRRAE